MKSVGGLLHEPPELRWSDDREFDVGEHENDCQPLEGIHAGRVAGTSTSVGGLQCPVDPVENCSCIVRAGRQIEDDLEG